MPVVVLLVSLAGLIVALLIEGHADTLAAAAVAFPLFVIAWAVYRSKYSAGDRRR